ncbi:MAG: tetratricopeptide repeat protein [Roseivirga sp.]|nr:tetratricopeptide repeat protein [Roseivirga sp.]
MKLSVEKQWGNKWPLIVIAVACLGSYFMSLSNGYAIDDQLINSANPYVSQGIAGIGDIFLSPMGFYEGKGFEFRPIATSTFALEYELFGENPRISHLINLLIYTLACCLLYLTLRQLGWKNETYWAFWAVLIFAVHPMHSEVVNNLKNRDELLAFLLGLISFWYAIKFLHTNKGIWLMLAGFSMSIAIFSKVSAVPMVLIIPFVLWFVKRASLQRALGIFVTLFTFGWLRNLWMNLKLGGNLERGYAFYENPLFFSESAAEFVSTAFASICFYFKMVVYPYPLVSYYGYNQAPTGDWLSIETILGLVLCLIILVILIWRRKQRDLLNLGLCLWVIAIAPYTNLLIPAPGVVAERFAFLSVLGFGMVVSHWVSRAPAGKVITVSLICLVAMGYDNYRSSEWKDSFTLFKADVNRAPKSAKLHFLLADQYQQKAKEAGATEAEGFYHRAIEGYQKAVEIDPTYSNAYNVMGMVYYNNLNSPGQAIPQFQKALKLKPQSASVLYNLASAYREAGDLKQAASYFAKSIQQGRKDYLTHAQLSDLLMKLGQFRTVVAINQNADFEANKDQLLTFTGLAQLHLGDTISALKNLEEALLLSPGSQLLKNEILKVRQSQKNGR